jgi:hypothetical protein
VKTKYLTATGNLTPAGRALVKRARLTRFPQGPYDALYENKMCIMQLVTLLTDPNPAARTATPGDKPTCVSPAITRFMIALNDEVVPTQLARARLKDLVPDVIGTFPTCGDGWRDWHRAGVQELEHRRRKILGDPRDARPLGDKIAAVREAAALRLEEMKA